MRIAINTLIIYFRMLISALISLYITRYVLMVLGVSDYGLYNVVGGVVVMLNFVSIGMITTTRRFVNVEMGKKEGNVNKVFNVCLILHLGFAVFIYLLAISLGLWYINNMLNVNAGKLTDARFVFFISTTVSALGIVNVPYQALMTAYERFRQMAIIDIISSLLKIPMVFLLLIYTGNHLRFYAIAICLITLCSLIAYFLYCYKSFREIVRWNFYKSTKLYKEILLFNNYTAMGSFAYLTRSNGSSIVINFFFGTIVNGAYAVAMQIESQIQNFVGNLATAANPQMTQSYSAGHFERSFNIVCKITRFSAMIMTIMTFSLFMSIDSLLKIWLKEIPEGTVPFCKAILLSLFISSLAKGIDSLIQATGKVKWYQIIQSILLVAGIPLAITCFVSGLPPVFIIYSFIVCDIIRTIAMFVIICHITPFDFKRYAVNTYIPIIKIVFVLSFYYLIYQYVPLINLSMQFWGFLLTLLFSTFICGLFGMTGHERLKLKESVLNRFTRNKK